MQLQGTAASQVSCKLRTDVFAACQSHSLLIKLQVACDRLSGDWCPHLAQLCPLSAQDLFIHPSLQTAVDSLQRLRDSCHLRQGFGLGWLRKVMPQDARKPHELGTCGSAPVLARGAHWICFLLQNPVKPQQLGSKGQQMCYPRGVIGYASCHCLEFELLWMAHVTQPCTK